MHYKVLLPFLSLLWTVAQAQHQIHRYMIVKDNLVGYINEKGAVVIEPRFRNGADFSEGLAAVREGGYWGYINEQGAFKIPPQYEYATPFDGGLALVVKDSQMFRIDTKGTIPVDLQFQRIKAPETALIQFRFRNREVSTLNQYKVPMAGDEISWERGLIGAEAAIIARWNKKTGSKDYGVIDSTGEFIVPLGRYSRIYPFENGIANVDREQAGYINTKGVISFNKRGNYRYKLYNTADTIGNYIFFKGEVKLNDTLTVRRFGVKSINGNLLIAPCFDAYDKKGFREDVLLVIIGSNMAYINQSGKIIWKFETAAKIERPNIDYGLSRGFYPSKMYDPEAPPASVEEIAMLQRLGCQEGSISLRVRTEKLDTLPGNWLGHRVYLANLTSVPMIFSYSSGEVRELDLQALNPNGKWCSILNIPNEWCGTGMYSPQLAPHDYWFFDTPLFDGAYKTKLRIVADYSPIPIDIMADDDDERFMIISNEFEGGVNPGQFWRMRPGYYGMGIMDRLWNYY